MKIVLLFLFFIAFIENSLAMNYGLEAQFQVKEESTKRQAFGEVILNTDSSKIFFTGNFDTSVGNFSLENYGLLFSKNIQFFLGTASFSGVMSVFKNPQGDSAGRLLDACGVKDLSFGGVKVWENHANFIVNYNNGTSEGVLNLMYEMKKRVKEKFGIDLKPEVRYLGNCKEEVELCKKLYLK